MGYRHTVVVIGGKKESIYLSIDDIQRIYSLEHADDKNSGSEVEVLKTALWLALRKSRPDLPYEDMSDIIGEMPGEYISDKIEYLAGVASELLGGGDQQEKKKKRRKTKTGISAAPS